MIEFTYSGAASTADAVRAAIATKHSKYLGGGTNLIDLMRETIEQPAALIDVTNLSRYIETREDGSILIGAGVKNAAIAANAAVRERFPLLARALLSGASGQIRNMATLGGNIMQRTRCYYFYDEAARCNKRAPGSGCDAVEGFNRIHAILGASPACVATHPSDMCVALAALDATVLVEGQDGARRLPFVDLHRLPGGRPDIETTLAEGELITGVELRPLSTTARSTYRKVRDRASYAFALVSVAAVIDLGSDGLIRDIRLALGGVAHKPWRAFAAEDVLRGAKPTPERFRAAAEAELRDAAGLRDNLFKIELAKRTVVSVLEELTREAQS